MMEAAQLGVGDDAALDKRLDVPWEGSLVVPMRRE
jgi:hypothetical protein